MKFNAVLRGIRFALHVSCVGMFPKRVLAVWHEPASKTSGAEQMHAETNASDQTSTEMNASCVIKTTVELLVVVVLARWQLEKERAPFLWQRRLQ